MKEPRHALQIMKNAIYWPKIEDPSLPKRLFAWSCGGYVFPPLIYPGQTGQLDKKGRFRSDCPSHPLADIPAIHLFIP